MKETSVRERGNMLGGVLMKEAEKCFFCQKPITSEKDRLEIMQHAMCPECEKQLLSLPVGDKEYDLYKDKIKKIWFS